MLYLDKLMELVAAALGLHSVFALARMRRVGWLTGLASTLLSIGVFWLQGLFGQVVLMAFFSVMSFIGWRAWQANEAFVAQKTAGRDWAIGMGLWLVLWAGCWWVLSSINRMAPGLDAFVFAGSMVATWWQTRKIIGSWVLWAVIDVVSVWLYSLAGLWSFSLLYTAFLLLCIRGYLTWKES